ncbi:MAG: hypothetical protein RRZ71_05835 [Clostridia bacterium]
MKWWSKLIMAVVFAAIFVTIGIMVFSLASMKKASDYCMNLGISMSAAQATNGVHINEDGKYYQINEDGCRKLYYFLSSAPKLTLARGDADGESMEILIGDDTLRMVHKGNNADDAIVYFECMDKTYKFSISVYQLWDKLKMYTGAEYRVADTIAQ